jgi:hypothetical protein
MKKLIILGCFLISATMSFSQVQDVYAAVKTANKYAYNDKYIKLFMGDEVFVEVEVSGKTITKMTVVPEMKDPKKTFTISFKTEDFGGQNASILHIKNPFHLSYKAVIQRSNEGDFNSTSVVDLFPGVPSMEEWPYRIVSIVLSDFTLK